LGGFEVMAEMKKDEKLAKIPVIIISNSGQPLELERAKELGAADWLVKTEFDPKEVADKIQKYIGE
jgi:CheY-like chemotaxis protein